MVAGSHAVDADECYAGVAVVRPCATRRHRLRPYRQSDGDAYSAARRAPAAGARPLAIASRCAPRDPSAGAARPACMLQELRVENLLLIERAELRLAPG